MKQSFFMQDKFAAPLVLRQGTSFCPLRQKSFYILNLYLDEKVIFNASTYTFVPCIPVCDLDAGSTCAAHAAAGHFLLPIAAKGSKSAFRLPKQKAIISATLILL